MTTEEAKKILSFYRPGSADMRDPEFAEALELARRAGGSSRRAEDRNPELAKWFEEHCANYVAMQGALREIAVPGGLKEQILAERKIVLLPVAEKKFRWAVPLALAAGLVGLLCAVTFGLHRTQKPLTDFEACRDQMVRLALNPYGMDLLATNGDRVRGYLAGRSAPADYTLPARLAGPQLVGCAVKSWNNAPVSMICFRTGQPGEAVDLWLFVLDAKSVHDAPGTDTPAFAAVNRGETASWTVGDRTYILVGDGDKKFVEKYL